MLVSDNNTGCQYASLPVSQAADGSYSDDISRLINQIWSKILQELSEPNTKYDSKLRKILNTTRI